MNTRRKKEQEVAEEWEEEAIDRNDRRHEKEIKARRRDARKRKNIKMDDSL